MDAIWKTIPSAPNYEVSNLGWGTHAENVGCIVKRKTWAHV